MDRVKVVLTVWLVALVISGFAPADRLTWILEVFPVLIAAPFLYFTRTSFPLPNYLYGWIIVHGLVLMIGGQYTYAEVPVGFWLRDAFDLSRNHFDRLGHFLQGFVPALLTREILLRKNIVRAPGWLFFLSVCVCMAFSASYEFLEWGSALILGQGADAFLGTQGDPWDTQWDMFLATVGAISALSLYKTRNPSSPQR